MSRLGEFRPKNTLSSDAPVGAVRLESEQARRGRVTRGTWGGVRPVASDKHAADAAKRKRGSIAASSDLMLDDSQNEADDLLHESQSEGKRRRKNTSHVGGLASSGGYVSDLEMSSYQKLNELMDTSSYSNWRQAVGVSKPRSKAPEDVPTDIVATRSLGLGDSAKTFTRSTRKSNEARSATTSEHPTHTQPATSMHSQDRSFSSQATLQARSPFRKPRPRGLLMQQADSGGARHTSKRSPPAPGTSAGLADMSRKKGSGHASFVERFPLTYYALNGSVRSEDLTLVIDVSSHAMALQHDDVEVSQKIQLKDVASVYASEGGTGRKIRINVRNGCNGIKKLDFETQTPAIYRALVTLLEGEIGTIFFKEDEWMTKARIRSQEHFMSAEHAHTSERNRLADLKAQPLETERSAELDSVTAQPERRPKVSDQLRDKHGSAGGADISAERELPQVAPIAYSLRRPRRAAAIADGAVQALPTTPDHVLLEARHRDFGEPWTKPFVYPKDGKRKATVDFQDLLRLDEGEFLNDNLIGFYLRVLMERMDETSSSEAKRVYWFNSYFFEKLTSTPKGTRGINYEAVKRWTKDVDLFSYDYVVVPVNESAHWYVVVICNLPALFDPRSPTPEAPMVGSSPHHPIGLDDRHEPPAPTSPMDSQLPVHTAEPPSGRSEPRVALGDITHDTIEDPSIEGISMDMVPATPPAPASPKATRTSQRRKRRPSVRQYDPRAPSIITLDSLGIAHAATTRALKSYLVEEAREKKSYLPFDEGNIQGMNAKGIPLQDNFCDCGLYLLGYMDKFIEDPREFVRKILRREFDEQADWPELQPAQMRHNIRELILKLHKDQKSPKKLRRRALPRVSDPNLSTGQHGPVAGHGPADVVHTPADEPLQAAESFIRHMNAGPYADPESPLQRRRAPDANLLNSSEAPLLDNGADADLLDPISVVPDRAQAESEPVEAALSPEPAEAPLLDIREQLERAVRHEAADPSPRSANPVLSRAPPTRQVVDLSD